MYSTLMLRPRDYMTTAATDKNYKDIHLLSRTLLKALSNMPSSLFCDGLCEGNDGTVVDQVLDIADAAKRLFKQENDDWREQAKALPDWQDSDMLVMQSA